MSASITRQGLRVVVDPSPNEMLGPPVANGGSAPGSAK